MLTKVESALSEALVEKGLVPNGQMAPLMEEVSKSKDSLFALLLKSGVVSEELLLKCLSQPILKSL